MNNSIVEQYQSQLQELFGSAGNIGIIVGENQNVDTMGAALGLFMTFAQNGISAQIVSKKDPIVELSHLFGIDKVKRVFDGDTKILTISVPYREGEIEKVSYNIEQDKLNVNLFAEENGITFSESDIEYIRKGSSPSVIVAIGVADQAEISGIVDLKSVRLVSIDKSPLSALEGEINLVDPSFSSVSEIVTSVVRTLGFRADGDAMQNLMDGITYATRNFTLPTTSATAFEAAGFLLSNGARRKERTSEARQANFPESNQFLNRRPRQQQQQQNQNRGGRPQNQPQQRQNFGQQQGGFNQGNQPGDQRQNPNQNQPSRQNEPQKDTAPQPSLTSFEEPMNNPSPISEPKTYPQDDVIDATPVDDTIPENVPDDWFLPKVFKTSKKGQQN